MDMSVKLAAKFVLFVTGAVGHISGRCSSGVAAVPTTEPFYLLQQKVEAS